jgi:hypothetical protein
MKCHATFYWEFFAGNIDQALVERRMPAGMVEGTIRRFGRTLKNRRRQGSQRKAGKPSHRFNGRPAP